MKVIVDTKRETIQIGESVFQASVYTRTPGVPLKTRGNDVWVARRRVGIMTWEETQKFKNEMEAHLNEREYLDQVAKKYESVNLAKQLHNQIVAAGVPLVSWVEVAGNSKSDERESLNKPQLCDELIRAYQLSRDKISQATQKTFGCTSN